MEVLITLLGSLLPVALVGLFLFQMAVKIIQEYERGVIFRLGRVVAVREPGLRFIVPFIDRMPKVDMRVITLDVPSQEAITGDNVTIKVNAVVYYRVLDPVAALVNVENYMRATSQIAQTSLRNVIGQSELDELLSRREEINQKLQEIIDEATEPWGIKVSVVEVKDVELPENMKRAMAKQAEAERERRAKIIHAAGESEAAVKLAEAAAIMGAEPTTIQLRYLQTLVEISAEHNSTIVFPLPIEMLKALLGGQLPGGGSGGGGSSS
jgi:regulator of protease activity HflC (stomatin/prohibitin superfamily)